MARRVAILADLEGSSGVRTAKECFPNFQEFQSFGLPNMAADVNAAARGLRAGGFDEVVVVDGHLIGQNLISASLEAGASLSKGTLVDELQRGGLAGVFLTGIHGKTGTPNSFSSNTIAPFVAARLNGDIIGDALLLQYLCAEYDVPLLGVSGDWVACEEVQWTMPSLAAAPTKTGFDRASVRHHDPAVSRGLIEQVAAGVATAPAPRMLKAPASCRLELSFADEADAKAAAAAVDGSAKRQRRVLALGAGKFEEQLATASKAIGRLYPGWVDGLGQRAPPPEPSGRTAGGMLDERIISRFYEASAPYWSD